MKKTSGAKDSEGGASPSHLIDAKIAALGDWRGETLARVRALIKEADPDMAEDVKWRKPSNPLDVPVWEQAVDGRDKSGHDEFLVLLEPILF